MNSVSFVLLPNRKPRKYLLPEQNRFWNAQWLGRLKYANAFKSNKKITGIPFDKPEVPYTAIYLLSIIKKIGGFKTNLLDIWQPGITELNEEIVLDVLASCKSKVFLFSPFTNNYSFAKQCVQIIKRTVPDSFCIIGGPHASYCAKECLHDGFDIVICGQGEEVLLDILQSRILHKRDYPKIIHGEIGSKGEQERWRDVLPAYDLLPQKFARTYYARLFTTHGCPFSCIFCSNTIWKREKVIFMPLNRVSNELDLIQKYIKFNEIYINDENFTMRKDHYEPITQMLKVRGIPWGCETRVDIVNQETLKLLSNNGCCEIDYGLESLNKYILKKVNKGINCDDVYRVFSETANLGIRTHVNLMVGLPGETIKSAHSTIKQVCEWINEGIINTVDYFVTVPYPGTELFRNREKFSLTIKTQDWDEYREDSIPVFDLNTLSGAEIFECWKYGLTRFSEAIEEKWKKGEQL